MKNYPLISVIVPFFNSVNDVKKCLDSLFFSTYENIEVVCVDDGSTDETWAVLKKNFSLYKNFIFLRNKKNRGVAYSRSRALKHCHGEYVMFCDGDDTFSSDMISRMFKALMDNSVDLVVCDTNLVYDDCSKDDLKTSEKAFLMDEGLCGKMYVNDLVIMKTTRVLWNKLFKKELIDRFNIDFPMFNVAEDVAFFLKYLSVTGSVFFIREKLYNYTRTKDSLINRRFDLGVDAVDDCVKALENVLVFMDKNNIFKNRKIFEVCYENEIKYSIDLMKKLLDENLKEQQLKIDEMKNSQLVQN